jgi:hypothetical protein
MFIPDSPPPRQEGMSAKFHHSTILKNFRRLGNFPDRRWNKIKEMPEIFAFFERKFLYFQNYSNICTL